jgi:hypothetical protein
MTQQPGTLSDDADFFGDVAVAQLSVVSRGDS